VTPMRNEAGTTRARCARGSNSTPAAVRAGEYCSEDGCSFPRTCSFSSMEQCKAAISGAYAVCLRDSFFKTTASRRSTRAGRRDHAGLFDYMPHLNDAWAPPPNTVLPCEAGGRAMATTVEGPVGSHDNDWTSAETVAGRNVGLSVWRGVRGRCPRCGRGRLFCAFLKVDDHCSVCRLDFTGHRADDLPAYLVGSCVAFRG
jgi:Protein of unknown function (DUF983)/Protein of unknown function (DUF3551)